KTLQYGEPIGITGVELKDGTYYVASYFTGDILVFDRKGRLKRVIETGLGAGVLSDLAFDPKGEYLLLASGFGDGSVRRIALDGTFLDDLLLTSNLPLGDAASFALPMSAPGNSRALAMSRLARARVAEPGSFGVFAAGLFCIGVLTARRWRTRRPAPVS